MNFWRCASIAAVIMSVAGVGPAAGSAGAARGDPKASGSVGGYLKPPTSNDGGPDQWYWEIDPPSAGLRGLPATSAPYPQAGSANIWDTDLFADSNTKNAGIPTGASPVVRAIHDAGHYSICYVEAGAFQAGFPDEADFAAGDYGNRAKRYQMQGYSNEWWFDTRGFAHYDGHLNSLTGAASNIARGIAKRISWCKLEGQDGLEPDDLDGYSNRSASGAGGGGWGLTRAEAAGYERWLAETAHSYGLAIFQKNDTANAAADEPLYDGVITEECNYYKDPCSGPDGDWNRYLAARKPVLNAEYTSDHETSARFCGADEKAGLIGALFDVGLDGKTYKPCER